VVTAQCTEPPPGRIGRDYTKDTWQRFGVQKHIQEDDTDLEARCLLIENDHSKKQEGIRLLERRYKRPLMAFLGANFSDLDEEDRATAVNDALVEVYRMACDGTLDIENELGPLLFTIAQYRSIDQRRKNSRRIPAGMKLRELVGDYLAGTDTGADWRMAVVIEKAGEVVDEFRQFVGTLKAKQQRRVASVMADRLPDWMSDREIADEIRERYGIHVSQLEVKGAKQALVQKFREILKRRIK